VLSGLQAGDKLIVEGTGKVAAGQGCASAVKTHAPGYRLDR
jgi:hypothetical protein